MREGRRRSTLISAGVVGLLLGFTFTSAGCNECDNRDRCYEDCDEAYPEDAHQRSLCYASCDQQQSDCSKAGLEGALGTQSGA